MALMFSLVVPFGVCMCESFGVIFFQIIRRSGPEEKVLCVVRRRPNHKCDTAVIVIGNVVWDGVAPQQADLLYSALTKTVAEHGFETERRCGTNEQ